jgi:hypothetical protein
MRGVVRCRRPGSAMTGPDLSKPMNALHHECARRGMSIGLRITPAAKRGDAGKLRQLEVTPTAKPSLVVDSVRVAYRMGLRQQVPLMDDAALGLLAKVVLIKPKGTA